MNEGGPGGPTAEINPTKQKEIEALFSSDEYNPISCAELFVGDPLAEERWLAFELWGESSDMFKLVNSTIVEKTGSLLNALDNPRLLSLLEKWSDQKIAFPDECFALFRILNERIGYPLAIASVEQPKLEEVDRASDYANDNRTLAHRCEFDQLVAPRWKALAESVGDRTDIEVSQHATDVYSKLNNKTLLDHLESWHDSVDRDPMASRALYEAISNKNNKK